MLKLYKNDNGTVHYWETWHTDKKTGIVHWGVIGEKGKSKEVTSGWLTSFGKAINKETNEKRREGYAEIAIEDHYTLLIAYAVEGMGTPDDINKQGRLQDKMNEVLGWTGLGECDGESIGSGTMEVCCYVVDFGIAKKVIENALANTEFSDYIRIYDENEDAPVSS
jgi:hypothetical protein